jgi:GR25 family glycosyltransferase involved in LPS biosynthesis
MSDPHVYVIHLKHRADRKKQFLEAWTAAGLSLKKMRWYPAVLGSALPESQLSTFRTVAKTRKARAGRVGCYCSHTAAIQKAIQRNHFPLLILEDDAVPTSHIADLATLFSSAPSSASLLYFGALPVKQRKRITTYCKGRNGWFHPGDEKLYGGHAYGIPTKEAAQELSEFLKENKMTYDSALVRYTKLHKEQVAVHCPFQFIQSEGYSNIEDMRRPIR